MPFVRQRAGHDPFRARTKACFSGLAWAGVRAVVMEMRSATEQVVRLTNHTIRAIVINMKSYSASYFKTHFGSVLDRAGMEPVRIERRGRRPAVLIPESEYEALKHRMRSKQGDPAAALSRLKSLALGEQADLEKLRSDPRSAIILERH
jgi:prevent-host-death family protein